MSQRYPPPYPYPYPVPQPYPYQAQPPYPYPVQPPYPYPVARPYPYPVAPPKKSSAGMILLVVGLVVALIMAVVVAGIVAISYVLPNLDNPAGPNWSPPTSDWPPAPPDVTSPYVAPAPDPKSHPVAVPGTADEATQIVENNALYGQSLVPVSCDKVGVNFNSALGQELDDGLNAFTACLMNAWHQPVGDAGFELPRPTVKINPETTPCGYEGDWTVAFYCSADQQIYWPDSTRTHMSPAAQNRVFYGESRLAHEFGHAIQYRTGILMSMSVLKHLAPTSEAALEYNRRMELQAQCLSGAFTTAVAYSLGVTYYDKEVLVRGYGNVKDDDDHGTAQNYSYWFNEGVNATSLADCNTFIAPASLVA